MPRVEQRSAISQASNNVQWKKDNGNTKDNLQETSKVASFALGMNDFAVPIPIICSRVEPALPDWRIQKESLVSRLLATPPDPWVSAICYANAIWLYLAER